MVVLDGGRGAYYAIKQTWPTTRIQRCLVHAQRVVRRHLTSRPRTDAGKTLYKLALDLTRITTIDQAAQWTAHLQEFDTVYRTWMDEKTLSITTGKRELRLPSFSGHPINADLVSVREDVHCESTTPEIHT